MNTLINARFIEAAGSMLLHSLWQLSLGCLVLAGLLFLFRNYSAALRYRTAVAVQVLCVMTAAFTFFNSYTATARTRPVGTRLEARTYEARTYEARTYEARTYEALPQSAASFSKNAAIPWSQIIVLTWLAGLLLFSIRLAGGWLWLKRLGSSAMPASGEWTVISKRLSNRLSLRKPVRIMESLRIQVPVVMGYFKPVILVPVAVINQLSIAEVEAILAHELAHIKRSDYLVNLLQSIAEALFFFHPGMYWVNSVIRRERENCCDDLAVSVHGSPIYLARALESLASAQLLSGNLALAATGEGGKPLLNRIRRILLPGSGRLFPERSLTLGILLLLMLAGFAGISKTISLKNAEPFLKAAIPGNISYLWASGTEPLYSAEKPDSAIKQKVIIITTDNGDSVYVNGKKMSRAEFKKEGKTDFIEIDPETAKQITMDYFQYAHPGNENSFRYEFRMGNDSANIWNFIPEPAPFPPLPAMPPMAPMPAFPPMSPMPPMVRIPPMPSFDKNLSQREREKLHAAWEKTWDEYGKEFEKYNEQMDHFEREMDIHNREMDTHDREMEKHDREMGNHDREMQQVRREKRIEYNPEQPGDRRNEYNRDGRDQSRDLEKALILDKLIKDTEQYSFELNEKTMKVNGVKQPDEVAERYRKMLFAKDETGTINIEKKK